MAIPRVIKRTMDMHEVAAVSVLEVVRRADSWARLQAQAAAGEVELNSVGRPN
jgi:hypothetical protein